MCSNQAITVFDDIERHPYGCSCGLCDSVGRRSFGVAIKLVVSCPGEDNNVSLEKAIFSDVAVDRVFASSPSEAREKAKGRLLDLGYYFLADV